MKKWLEERPARSGLAVRKCLEIIGWLAPILIFAYAGYALFAPHS